MKVQLIEMEPQLKDKSEATAKLMKNLTKEKAQADEVRQVVVNDEAVVKVCILGSFHYLLKIKEICTLGWGLVSF